MKFFILLFILACIPINAQISGEAEYLAKYEVRFSRDTTNRDNQIVEIHRLYTGSETSWYVGEGKFIADSLRSLNLKESRNYSTEFDRTTYKDFKKGETYVQKYFSLEQYIFKEPAVPLPWKLEEDTKTIGDYTVHKATVSFGGRDWEAWFTLEIPLRDGPDVFSGLPGLILELSDSRQDFVFNLMSFKKLKNPIVPKIEKETISIDKKDFVKAWLNDRQSPQESFTQKFGSNIVHISFMDEDGNEISEKEFWKTSRKSFNNYFELWQKK